MLVSNVAKQTNKQTNKHNIYELENRRQIQRVTLVNNKAQECTAYMGYIGMCGPKGYGFFSRFGHK